MRISRIDRTLERCEKHLSSAQAYGTEIESLLTQSLLVVMYAEFERTIKDIVREKCLSIMDDSIKGFFESCVNTVIRGIKSSEITGLLGRFGPTHKEKFRQQIENNQRAETYYSNILTNRHSVAHSEGSNATFQEVKKFYEEGHVLLDFFREALHSEGNNAEI